MICREPSQRISAAQALEHAWFKKQLHSAPPALPQRSNIIPHPPKQKRVAVPGPHVAPETVAKPAAEEKKQKPQRGSEPPHSPAPVWHPGLQPAMVPS